MALANFTDLKASIADWMARSDLTTVIPDFITIFEARVNRQLKARQMITSTTLTPSSGSATLPTDYLEWKRVTWTGSPYRELEYVEPTYLKAAYPTAPTDLPTVFTIEGSTLKIAPLSDTALDFLYSQKVPALSVSATTNWLLTAHPDLYLFGSVTAGKVYMQDLDKAAFAAQQTTNIIEDINKLARQTQGQARTRAFGATP